MQALLKENRGIIAAAQRERLTQDGFVSGLEHEAQRRR